uniref:Uncharacterized protein n=3 Tax=Chrysotila carterae TaxID=13221 RepID=A0A7S4B8K6_CHRCT
MYLGQLAEGEKALGWFQQGIQRLRSERAALEGAGGSKDDLRREWLAATNALAAGLCAEAEIYLTDACDEDDAEMKCEALATEALLLVSGIDKQTLPEPYQTMASLRLSQQRPEDAEALLAKALSITESLEGSAQQPSLEMRTALSKLLMEVGMSAEALDLLQELRLEDDESLELWYLVVCAALQSGELEIAQAELEQALQFAQSDACPADEREWLPQLMELQSDVDGASRDQLADGEADEMDSSR